MRLMILRHAKAQKAEPGEPDRDRPLAPRGHKDADRIGRYLAHHALIPDRALVSPARRTRETWERLAATWPAPPPVDFDQRLYNGGAQTVLHSLVEAGGTAGALLIVGHNPGLHELARLLIAAGEVEAREQLNERLPTAGLAVIDFAGNDWRTLHAQGGRLERLITPGLLKASTD